MTLVQTGLETLIADPPGWLAQSRLGLLCNPASVDHRLVPARERIEQAFPGRLTALFSPQHGFFAEKQDNMIESAHFTDPALNLPVFSLYGETRVPTAAMFDLIDVLLVDLQDVGTRVYTFIYTLSHCMEAARACGKKVVVLDRPNPINGLSVEGNLLRPAYASFVGRYPLPMRHGLTIAELALLFNGPFGIGCDLEVIPMKGWERRMYFAHTGLPWVAPSPNMPSPATALVYPGQVIWEGTHVSEGRGTTQPFEYLGAPFLDPGRLLAALGGRELPGAVLRTAAFEPTANKWAGELCHGFQIHVTDPSRFDAYLTGLRLLGAVLASHGDAFAWKPPPYEYEFEKMPIDLILGDKALRRQLEAGADALDLAASWEGELKDYARLKEAFHLYP